MAFEQSRAIVDGTRLAGADLSADFGKFVKLDGNSALILCTAVTDVPYGVVMNSPREGEPVECGVSGIFEVVANAALATPGTLIGTSAQGQASALTPGTDLTKYIVGRTIEVSGGAGEVIACVINCAAPARAA